MLSTDDVEQVVAAWKEQAANLRQFGALEQAATIDMVLEDLEARSRSTDDGLLTLDEAANETGYSRDHMGRLIREGELPNAGRKNAPRIRRSDLARLGKGRASRRNVAPRTTLVSTRKQIARAVVNRHAGGDR